MTTASQLYASNPLAAVGTERIIADGADGVTGGLLSQEIADLFNGTKGADVASAATTNLGAATGIYDHVTGTTGITAFDNVSAGTMRFVTFTGILTLTHDGTSLILPGAANITTQAGDCAAFVSEGSGNWRCIGYMRMSVPLIVDTDGTLAANSDARVATQKAVATAITAAVTGLFDFKGATDCSANPNYPAASKGDVYLVSVAGKIGGAAGVSVDAGDMFVATADNAGGTQAAVGASWDVIEHNLVGALLTANALSELTGVAGTARSNIGAAQALVPTAVKTANYAAAAGDFVPCDVSGGSFTLTLPTAPADGTRIGAKIIAINSPATNLLNLATGGADVFNVAGGATTGSIGMLNQAIAWQYKASSAIWYVVSADTPVLNSSSVIKAAQRHVVYANAPADVAGVVTLDLSLDVDVWRLTLTKNITIAFSNVPAASLGAEKEIIVTQDGTGGWTLAWPAGSKYPDGLVPVQTAAANAKDRYAFYADALPTYTVFRAPNLS